MSKAFVKKYLEGLVNADGRMRSLQKDERPPRGFQFKAAAGNGRRESGIVQYNGAKYAYYAPGDGSVRVMTETEAGGNWSETLYNDDLRSKGTYNKKTTKRTLKKTSKSESKPRTSAKTTRRK